MDRQTAQSGSGATILIIILAIVAGLAVAGALYSQNRVMQLQKQVTDLTRQVEEVGETTQGAKEGVAEVVREVVEVAPVRLALFKAYANKLRAGLTPEAKADLDKIVVYIEKQPVVLVQKPTQLPAEIQTAVDNIKTEVQKAKVTAVASSASEQLAGTPTPAAGKTVTLTGTWMDAGVDPVVGGQVFTLVNQADKQTYYFQFSGSNLAAAQALIGEEVTITVKTTGTTADGMVTYEVVTGPTATAVTATPRVEAEN
ncbi:hypothetical protein A2W24_05150 [Microgenomates group bacterium RBG_16_45_19]|nr:MAG: hypothetical protein A2W24_05150 [Microgenomates group bacterium RBG_16_45_19]